jgi:hypothetical protein
MNASQHLRRFIHNEGLFASDYFGRVLEQKGFPEQRRLPDDWAAKLEHLRRLWVNTRPLVLEEDRDGRLKWEGLPPGWRPKAGASESDIENGFIRRVLEEVLGYSVAQNRTFQRPRAAAKSTSNSRPDLIVFSHRADYEGTLAALNLSEREERTVDGVAFCRMADMIIDAKAFKKGVGADELPVDGGKRSASERTAAQDVLQVADYLADYQKKWGVLTNGRSWRLMVHGGGLDRHLRFDLVAFLEQLPSEPTADDERVFEFFWYLFGKPAVSGKWLDVIESGAAANTRAVRSVLRQQAHNAVERIANGFWLCPDNGPEGLTVAPALPDQSQIDHLREVSLTLLYRLLFVLKAEAQGLLPMLTPDGSETNYARFISTRAIFAKLHAMAPAERAQFSLVWPDLQKLFSAVDRGDLSFAIPAYNGGLFDPQRHPELSAWRLRDDALYAILSALIYQNVESNAADDGLVTTRLSTVPYADLDVRDLGDIYEGLLEQRLIGVAHPTPALRLKNQKGERKASGTYFTPDSLVEHLVRQTLQPKLEAAGDHRDKVLAIRILDPAMGSGHFLVKAVDIMADWLTVHCEPEDPDAPRNNGPEERAYWKRMVVEQCIYGVDYNPMAVELARVALWLHTAEFGKPLSFVDHHLKVGNSLVGITLDRLSKPGRKAKARKSGPVWEAIPHVVDDLDDDLTVSRPLPPLPSSKKGGRRDDSAQLALPFSIDTSLVTGILQSIHAILARPSNSAAETRKKSQDYAFAVEKRLAAHRLLADLWCLQWFFGPPTDELIQAYESADGIYAQVKQLCGIQDDAQRAQRLTELQRHPLIIALYEARAAGYGPRREAFFHWQLEFPEVAFSDDGQARSGFGFDVVVGNPPWDRIRAERKQFYAPFSDPSAGSDYDIANSQSASLDKIIRRLHGEHPTLEGEWLAHEQDVSELTTFLNDSGVYRHQSMKIDGKKTGGDPDLFRYFVERAISAARRDGRIGQLVPSTLWQAEGCSALRHLLLKSMTCEQIFVFENYRKWAFQIHSSFKFTAFVTRKERAMDSHAIESGFMLRDTRALDGHLPERVVNLTLPMIEAVSPGTLALLDYVSDSDARLVGRLHHSFPALANPQSGWHFVYRAELHMTNDAWRFKTREWMQSRGFLRVVPVKDASGGWTQQREYGSRSAKYPEPLPTGGEYWVAADASWYEERGYRYVGETVDDGHAKRLYVHPDDERLPVERDVPAERRHAIAAGEIYRALYVGRSVHQFDPAYQRYEGGAGPKQIWSRIGWSDKLRSGQFFIHERPANGTSRIAVRDIARATDERALITTLLPSDALCGNVLPVLDFRESEQANAMGVYLGSFVCDYLIRYRINTHVNWTYLKQLPVPAPIGTLPPNALKMCWQLCAATPEWDAMQADSTRIALSDRERARWRAQLDARVALAYELSVSEYAWVLSTFPLLDRSMPSLPDDLHLTQTEGAVRNLLVTTPWGQFDATPRSFITRDLALLTYIELRRELGYPDGRIPNDLHAFYRDEVGLDPEGPLSRFRIGTIRDLKDRVLTAEELGAVAYVPSGRGGDAEGETGEEGEEEG